VIRLLLLLLLLLSQVVSQEAQVVSQPSPLTARMPPRQSQVRRS